MNNYNVIKHKLNYEKICDFKVNGFLTSPREDNTGILYAVANTGEICYINEGAPEQIETQSQLSCLCFDESNGLYLGDLNVPAVIYKQTSKLNNIIHR
jgi:hypothetical protein